MATEVSAPAAGPRRLHPPSPLSLAILVAAGVLRGMGRTRPGAAFNLIAFWVIGLPLGSWLAFRDNYGLAGIWWGMCTGLAVVAAVIAVWLAWTTRAGA